MSVEKVAPLIDEQIPIAEALKKVVRLSLPNVASCLILFLSNVATVQSFSQRDALKEVSAIGLGGFMFSMFGLAIALGLSGALDTVVSQAIGSGQSKVATVNLAQARLVTLLAVVPCGIILFFTKEILVLLGQNASFAAQSAKYVHWQLFGLFPLFWYSALSCFLRASNRTTSPLIANIVGTVVHSALSLGLLYFAEMGVMTAGLIASGSNIVRWIILEVYILMLPASERDICSLPAFFKQISRKADFAKIVAGLGAFVMLALPSTMMMWSEWFAAEAQALIAGGTQKEYLPASIELATIAVMAFMVPVGICQTSSFLVGSSLGEGKANRAKAYGVASLYLTAFAMTVIAIVFYLIRTYLVSADHVNKTTTDKYIDPKVVFQQMMKAFPVLCAFIWIDGVQTVLEGVLRGMRAQKKAVWIKMFCMFGVRIALGFVLCSIAKDGVRGLYTAALVAMILSSSAYMIMLYRADWYAKAREAQEINEKSNQKIQLADNVSTPGAITV